MQILRRVADNRKSSSFATQLRKKRFEFFRSLIESVPHPIKILDVGGTQGYWNMMGLTDLDGIEVVLLNLQPQSVSHAAFSSVVGDATHMDEFGDGTFDVVFSNSVIEHVGTFRDQQRMADEVRRVGKRYFIQTPNRHFPVEPHFLVPLFQFYPISLRIWLLMHFNLGWFRKIPDRQQAEEAVREIRLLTKREMIRLFPGAEIYEEKFLGLTKSYVAYSGWN